MNLTDLVLIPLVTETLNAADPVCSGGVGIVGNGTVTHSQ